IYQISTDTLYQWQRKYETSGLEGLKESSYWKAYSKELMEAAVLDYLNHGLSKGAIVLKYEISSRSVLSRWIRKYTRTCLKTLPYCVNLKIAAI
ncbi:helix-turn-helix domain-containing protein, partial [Metalysinibacillus jejuensis]|uniref:helix-turn-helix domain-containing protein n=1 Tax=Metalysinibacillus jejuensis TaxID=914327 RepID=UPI001379E389